MNACDAEGSSPLLEAIGSGCVDLVLLLLQRQANPRHVRGCDGCTPLLAAVRADLATRVLAALLDAGAAADMWDQLGNTPLIEAASTGNLECLSMLLSRVPLTSINHSNSMGETALMRAAGQTRDPQLLPTLLAAGASTCVDSVDFNG